MSKLASGKGTRLGGLIVQQRRSDDLLGIAFQTARTAAPTDAADFLVYRRGSALYLWDGTVETAWGQAGGGVGGSPTWEQLFAGDSTFTITPGTTFTIAGNHADAVDVLTLTNIAGGSGNVLQITNTGTGNDIAGTSNTWNVTKAGVATFAGISISGTSSALVSTGAAVWTLKDADAAALSIGAAGATSMLVFDTSNGSEVVKTSATVFQVTSGKTNLINASNTVNALLVTDNTISTFGTGPAASAGMAVFRSTSLTTGTLLKLQLTEATLAGGLYLEAFDVTAGGIVFSIGEDGAQVITGAGGSDMLTVTAGDVVISDGSITLTDADNAGSIVAVNNTATSAAVYKFTGSGIFTGTGATSFFNITQSGTTAGTALTVIANSAATSVAVVDISTTGLTSGSALRITASTANFTTGGKALEIALVAATAGNGVSVVTTGAYTGTGLIIASAGAMTTGVMLSLASTTGLTSGSLIRATSSTAGAIATNGAISFSATGDYTSATANSGFVWVQADSTLAGTAVGITHTAATTGIGLHISSAGTGMTSGSLLRATTGTTGAVATNGVVSIRATGAFTSTSNVGILDVLASAATGAATVARIKSSAAAQASVEVLRVEAAGYTTGYSGIVMNVIGVATTGAAAATHGVLKLTGANTTGGNVLEISNNAITTGVGVLFAHTTSVIASGGTMFQISSSSIDTATTSGALLNLASTASTSATQVLATFSALTDGIGVSIVAAAATSGTLLKLSAVEATLTSGLYIQCFDGAANDFSVAKYGATVIAGNAQGTAALTVTAGDLVLTAGNATVGGKMIFSGAETIIAGGTSTALALTKTVHYIDADAGGDTFTLADGAEGQIMTIVMASSTGIATITPTNLRGGTSVTFNAAGDTVVLQFVSTKWSILGGNSYGVS